MPLRECRSTFSAIRLASLEAITEPVQGLVGAMGKMLRDPDGKKALLLARWEAQTYSNEEYVDLWDFCDRLQEYCGWERKQDSDNPAQNVKKAIDAAVVQSYFSGPVFQHSHGLSVLLSMVDEKGAPQNGFLRLNDIYNLHLPVDLVVLSACNSGLGKNVRGEGLIGLQAQGSPGPSSCPCAHPAIVFGQTRRCGSCGRRCPGDEDSLRARLSGLFRGA